MEIYRTAHPDLPKTSFLHADGNSGEVIANGEAFIFSGSIIQNSHPKSFVDDTTFIAPFEGVYVLVVNVEVVGSLDTSPALYINDVYHRMKVNNNGVYRTQSTVLPLNKGDTIEIKNASSTKTQANTAGFSHAFIVFGTQN
jgi:hypothetical protein